jgi:hypothetical protein
MYFTPWHLEAATYDGADQAVSEAPMLLIFLEENVGECELSGARG